MEKKQHITTKQLAFLEQFLAKYDFGSEDDKVELKDHLILDFEENGNGNLSQYLSGEMGFIKSFIGAKLKVIHANYRRKTLQEAFGFFTSIRKLPVVIILFLSMYVLTMVLNKTVLIGMFLCSVIALFVYSQFFLSIKNRDKKKLGRISYLGQEMWLPFLMVMYAVPVVVLYDVFVRGMLFFSAYWFVAVVYAIAAIRVMKKEKKVIYEKYKHLLEG